MNEKKHKNMKKKYKKYKKKYLDLKNNKTWLKMNDTNFDIMLGLKKLPQVQNVEYRDMDKSDVTNPVFQPNMR